MVNYAEFLETLNEVHEDASEIISKLEDFCTDAIGDVTFELSSGSTTISNLAKIQSNAYGSASRTAYDTLAQGDPITMYNDAGTAKAKKMVAGSWKASTEIETGIVALFDMVYDEDNSEVIAIFEDSANNLDIASGSISASTNLITWNSSVNISTTPKYDIPVQGIVCTGDGSEEAIALFYVKDSDGKLYYRMVDNDGSGSMTPGTETLLVDQTMRDFHVSYDATNNKIYIGYTYLDTNIYLAGNVLTVNGGTLSLSAGTPFAIANVTVSGDNNIANPRCCFNPNLGASGSICYAWSYTLNGLPDDTYVQTAKYDLNSTTLGAVQILISSDTYPYYFGDFKYDNDNDIAKLIIYERSRFYLADIAYTETLNSLTNMQLIHNNGADIQRALLFNSIYLDITNAKMYVIHQQNTSGTYTTCFEYNLTGKEAVLVSYYHYTDDGNNFFGHGSITVDTNGKIVFGFQADAAVKVPDERHKFVGFAEASITTGNAGLCSRIGSTTSAFSGLTIGKKYYLKEDLSLTTSPNPFPVGIAMDTDEILITGV